MEELLNKLIEKGWKPFGKTPVNINQWNCTQTYCKYFGKGCIHIHREDDIENEDIRRPRRTDEFSLRELVSKESGLWQYVCENGMIRVTEGNSLCNWLFGEEIYYDETQTDKLYKNDNYEYWIIESALCDEDKLEQFLLDNIKVS